MNEDIIELSQKNMTFYLMWCEICSPPVTTIDLFLSEPDMKH